MDNNNLKTLIIGGGCFWGVEKAFSSLHGVVETEVGYVNGNIENPTYEKVCQDTTGFKEAVKVTYDADVITLSHLMRVFFFCIDPTKKNQVGNDIGSQYQTGVYYYTSKDGKELEEIFKVERKKHPSFFVELEEVCNYYPAEEYHQKYLEKNPMGYCHITSTDMAMIDKINEELK